jgi:hypothetical protein
MTGHRGVKDMIGKTEAEELLDEVFEEEALVIGGLVAMHDIEDDLVWRLVRNLDVIRGKALRRIGAREPDEGNEAPKRHPNLRPHPAIKEFLRKIRSE